MTLRRLMLLTLLAFVLPIMAALAWWAVVDRPSSWRAADWGASGLLPPAARLPGPAVAVLAARTGGWKGAVSVHSWLVWKRAGDAAWTRHDVVGWGRPLRRDAYPPDGRWYSNDPFVVGALSGAAAAAAIPRLEAAVAAYPHGHPGAYRLLPGPNSNTFVAHVLREVPMGIALPPIAVGKDWLGDGLRGLRDAGGDLHLSAWGVAGLSVGPRTGVELHLLGQTLGLDVLRPALKLPGIGRVGLPPAALPAG